MAGRIFAQVIEGEWLDWNRHEVWRCCDCCMVHKVEVRTHKGQLQLRMFIDNRATAQIRRYAGIKVTTNKPKK